MIKKLCFPSRAFMPALAQVEREDIRWLAAYPEKTVGAVMTSDHATLHPNGGDMRVGIITHDDAMDVEQAETDIDFRKVGAVSELGKGLKEASIALLLYRKRGRLIHALSGCPRPQHPRGARKASASTDLK